MSYGRNYCLNSLRQKLLPREGLGMLLLLLYYYYQYFIFVTITIVLLCLVLLYSIPQQSNERLVCPAKCGFTK